MKEQWTNYDQIRLTMTQSEGVHSPGRATEEARHWGLPTSTVHWGLLYYSLMSQLHTVYFVELKIF